MEVQPHSYVSSRINSLLEALNEWARFSSFPFLILYSYYYYSSTRYYDNNNNDNKQTKDTLSCTQTYFAGQSTAYVISGSFLYFFVDCSDGTRNLLKTDGTAAGTSKLSTSAGQFYHVTIWDMGGNTLVFPTFHSGKAQTVPEWATYDTTSSTLTIYDDYNAVTLSSNGIALPTIIVSHRPYKIP